MAKVSAEITQAMGNRYYGADGIDAIKAFFMNYVNFKGRSTRREFWWWTLWNFLLAVICMTGYVLVMLANYKAFVLDSGSTQKDVDRWIMPFAILIVLYIAFALAILVPGIALIIRRFRDAGVPWWVYVLLVTIQVVLDIAMYDNNYATFFINGTISIILIAIEILPSKPLPDLPTLSL